MFCSRWECLNTKFLYFSLYTGNHSFIRIGMMNTQIRSKRKRGDSRLHFIHSRFSHILMFVDICIGYTYDIPFLWQHPWKPCTTCSTNEPEKYQFRSEQGENESDDSGSNRKTMKYMQVLYIPGIDIVNRYVVSKQMRLVRALVFPIFLYEVVPWTTLARERQN